MKQTFTIAWLCLLLIACNQQPTVTIKGDVDNLKQYHITSMVNGDVICEGNITKGNTITFNIDSKSPNVAIITKGKSDSELPIPIILDNEPIVFSIDNNNELYLESASEDNRKLSNVQKSISKSINSFNYEYQDFIQKYQGELPDSIIHILTLHSQQLTENIASIVKQTALDNKDNLIPIYFLAQYVDILDQSFITQYLNDYKHKDNPSLDNVRQLLNDNKNKAIGAMVTDLTMKNLQGHDIHLTDFVGKGHYVLVDFWASWCGPCRREMPNVKAAYEKFHNKGFEIVGISFDTEQKDWENAVAELGITWPQMSDLKGWDCIASSIYNIKSIPATILFSPEGKVLKVNLRGKEIEEELAKYLE